MRRACAVFAAIALVMATLPGGASAAGAYQQVLQVYEREGSIAPCQFSAAQLQSALRGIDTYGAQYFADFTQAVQAALTAQAAGACVVGSGARAGAPGAVSSSVPPPPRGSLTAATSGALPLPLALLGALAALGALGLGTRATMRRVRAGPAR